MAILSVLAVAGELGVSRDKLLALFWPESDEDRARGALKQALYALRRDVGESDLTLGTTALRLNADIVSSDVGLFEQSLALRNPERAVTCYTGLFLDGIHLRNLNSFEEWAENERVRLKRTFWLALEQLARDAAARSDFPKAAEWWRRRAADEPWSGRVARSYMEALVAAGEREVALRHGIEHIERVRAELGVEADSVHQMVERMRSVVPVIAMPALASSVGAVIESTGENDGASRAVPLDVRQSQVPSVAGRRLAVRSMALLALLVVGTAAIVQLRRTESPRQAVVIVAPFENETRDPLLNYVGRVAAVIVTEAITRTGLVGAVDAATALNPSRDSARSPFSPSALSDLVRATRARAVVSATFFRSGDSLEFRARITNGNGAAVESVIDPIRTSLDSPDLLPLSERVTGALASLLDTRIAILRNEASPPPSFEAYREYVEGLDYFVGKRSARFDYPGAIPHFVRAAQLDTTFSLPLIWLTFSYGNSFGMVRERDSVVRVLASRKERLAPLDRYALEYFLARGDQDAMYRWAAAASDLAPLSNWTHMRGVLASAMRHDDEAIAAFRRLDAEQSWIRNWTFYWERYTTALHDAGRFDDELAVTRKGLIYSLDPWSFWSRMRALSARGDVTAFIQLADSMMMLAPKPARARWMPAFNSAAAEAYVHDHSAAGAQLAKACLIELPAHPPDPLHPNDPQEISRYTNQLAECAYLLHDWKMADSLAAIDVAYNNVFGSFAAIRLVLSAVHRADSASFRQRLADAYARPEFGRDSTMRLFLDALLASLAGDARVTATNLARIPGQWGPGQTRDIWHTWTDITPAIRRSSEMRRLIAQPNRPRRPVPR